MRPFIIFRILSFSFLVIFSLLVLVLSAALLVRKQTVAIIKASPDSNPTQIQDVFISPASGFDLAVSFITLTIVIPSLVFTQLLETATWLRFFSFAWVEVIWITLLWILWMVAGAWLQSITLVPTFDTDVSGVASCGGPCAQTMTLEAFTWLAWLTVFVYLIWLGISIIASIRGNVARFKTLELEQILQDAPSEQTRLSPAPAEKRDEA